MKLPKKLAILASVLLTGCTPYQKNCSIVGEYNRHHVEGHPGIEARMEWPKGFSFDDDMTQRLFIRKCYDTVGFDPETHKEFPWQATYDHPGVQAICRSYDTNGDKVITREELKAAQQKK